MATLKNWLITAALLLAFAAGSVNWETATPSGLASLLALTGAMVLPLGIIAFVWRSASQNWLKRSAFAALSLFLLVNVIAFGSAGYSAAAIGVVELLLAALLLGLHLAIAKTSQTN